MLNPTRDIYCDGLSKAYEHFNKHLFNGALPNCLLTLQRKKNVRGYFSQDRMTSRDGKMHVDEIAMNPEHFLNRSTKEVLSTLVHEMLHLWQAHNGKSSRNGYHNKQWANKMIELGLIPTNTGKEGGKQTGQSVTHYIDKKGAYAKAYAQLTKQGFSLNFGELLNKDSTKKTGTRTKYTCAVCDLNAWARHGAKLICGDCHIIMIGVSTH